MITFKNVIRTTENALQAQKRSSMVKPSNYLKNWEIIHF